MVGSLECTFAGLQDLTHFLVFHIVEIAEGEDGPLYFGQRGYGLLEKGLGPVAIKIRIGRSAKERGESACCARVFSLRR